MRNHVDPVCHVSVEQVKYIPGDFTSHLRLQSHGPCSDGYYTPMLFCTWIFLVLPPLWTPSIGATTCALATWQFLCRELRRKLSSLVKEQCKKQAMATQTVREATVTATLPQPPAPPPLLISFAKNKSLFRPTILSQCTSGCIVSNSAGCSIIAEYNSRSSLVASIRSSKDMVPSGSTSSKPRQIGS